MKTYILNFKDKETADSLHDYLASMLDLPKHYGRNLDALYDCLTSITAPSRIMVANINGDNPLHKSTMNVLKDAADDNSRLQLLPVQGGWV
jgi:ribonuclease inhibitor